MFIKRVHILPVQVLSFMSLFFLALMGTALVLILLLSSQSINNLPLAPASQEKTQLPKNPFAQAAEAYEKIGEGPFKLKWAPPQMQLPDLRKELLYTGKNERPDIAKGKQLFHLLLRSSGELQTVRMGEKVFLVYQGGFVSTTSSNAKRMADRPLWNEPQHQNSKGTYAFSPGNQPTPLWIELRPLNEETLEVEVGMLDEKGTFVSSPEECLSFPLVKGDSRFQQTPWEVGGHRVDTTLLVRQKARWVGPDLFLEKHGGEDYATVIGRQRIDFIEEDTPYACFVKAGDFLIWEDNRWQVADDSNETVGAPLLVVKKIDEKVMSFELWDCEGKSKLMLSLIRMRDYDPFPEITQEFKFVGAKTWAQFIVECRSQRFILKPHDWLILTREGWHKINSPDEVDDFVNQKLTGPLFILDKMTKQNGRQVLLGHLFNATRTEIKEVELPAAQSPLANAYAPSITLPPPLRVDVVQELKGEER